MIRKFSLAYLSPDLSARYLSHPVIYFRCGELPRPIFVLFLRVAMREHYAPGLFGSGLHLKVNHRKRQCTLLFSNATSKMRAPLSVPYISRTFGKARKSCIFESDCTLISVKGVYHLINASQTGPYLYRSMDVYFNREAHVTEMPP